MRALRAATVIAIALSMAGQASLAGDEGACAGGCGDPRAIAWTGDPVCAHGTGSIDVAGLNAHARRLCFKALKFAAPAAAPLPALLVRHIPAGGSKRDAFSIDLPVTQAPRGPPRA